MKEGQVFQETRAILEAQASLESGGLKDKMEVRVVQAQRDQKVLQWL